MNDPGLGWGTFVWLTAMHPTGNPLFLDRLLEKGLVTAEQREAALNHHRVVSGRIEEVLLELGFVDEAALLKFLAAEQGTRFVSTERLSKADIPMETLALVPRKMAEQETVFPVLFDAASGLLSVVTADPDNMGPLRQLQSGGPVKVVRALVARPAAIRAAINKYYGGDIYAFAQLDRSAHEQFSNMLNVFERNLVSEESMTAALVREAPAERVLSERELSAGQVKSNLFKEGFGSDAYLETLNVMVSLLENARADLRGHSSQTARLMKKVAERIGLLPSQVGALQIAGYIHDLGKASAYHLTALNVALYDGHRTAARRLYRGPGRMLDAVGLPQDALRAVHYMYERFDGAGLPGELSGKDIPLGARLLAIADTFSDLTQNPRNPFRKVLRPAQACEALEKHKGTIFDANLVDLFRLAVTGDDLKARLLADRRLILLVEPDAEESTILELRLIEQGFEVRVARTADAALRGMKAGDVEVVVSEVQVDGQDGLSLMTESRKFPHAEKTPWIFLSSGAGRNEAQKAFELGAADYLNKPVAADLLVAKVKQVLEREARTTGARGVAGSLKEMGLPEIIQVLWHGRKTGALKIRAGREGGEIHLVDGQIWNALWGSLRGPEAFYAMVNVVDGDFVLEPNFRAPHQVINDSPEALLLEAMRRMDEQGAGR
jgi:response regulator RpfG family c-di-GMP phosphodiesterase